MGTNRVRRCVASSAEASSETYASDALLVVIAPEGSFTSSLFTKSASESGSNRKSIVLNRPTPVSSNTRIRRYSVRRRSLPRTKDTALARRT